MRKSSAREEILRCGRDPIYFINNYVKIRHPKRGLIPFKTYEYQERTVAAFLTNRFNIVLKPRQTGFTELSAAFVVWMILFHAHVSVLVLSTKADTAKNVIRRIRTTLKNLPSWLMVSNATTDNKMSIELDNGSWVKSSAKSADAGRSEALSLLLVDEAAHIEGFDEIWTAIKPTVTAGGRIIMLSTPNGIGNVFHRIYEDAESGGNDFNAIRVDWWEHPEHTQNLRTDPKTGRKTSDWFIKETRGFSAKQIAQEYECEFLASGDTFFSPELIALVQPKTPETEKGPNNELWIWRVPAPAKRYVVVGDVATGDGRDNSAAHVFDVETMEQVAEYQGKLPPDDFAQFLCDLAEEYNEAVLAVENNAVGQACISHIKMIGYRNLYHSKKGYPSEGKVWAAGYPMGDKSFVAGVTTSGANRSLMLSRLEELIRNNVARFNSTRFKEEMLTFIWNNGRPEARSGKTDDAIMAAAIGIWVREVLFGDQYNSPELAMAMLKSMKVHRTNNTQIDGASKNSDFLPTRALMPFGRPTNPNQVTLPNGKTIDMGAIVGLPFAPRKG